MYRRIPLLLLSTEASHARAALGQTSCVLSGISRAGRCDICCFVPSRCLLFWHFAGPILALSTMSACRDGSGDPNGAERSSVMLTCWWCWCVYQFKVVLPTRNMIPVAYLIPV
ncbi:unnamed protein product [Laminaria digitata]